MQGGRGRRICMCEFALCCSDFRRKVESAAAQWVVLWTRCRVGSSRVVEMTD